MGTMFDLPLSIRPSTFHRIPWIQLQSIFYCLLLWGFSAITGLPAGDPSAPITLPTTEDASKLMADSIVLGIVFIVSGILFTFWGAKLFRVCLFLAGAYLFAGLALMVLQKVEPQELFANRQIVYLSVTIVAAIIGGALLCFFYKVGVFAVGAFGGYTLALWILALGNGGLIQSSTGQLIFIIVLAVLGGVAILFVEPIALRLSTSIGGAFLTFIGIDMFARTGYAQSTLAFLGSPTTKYQTSTMGYVMLACTAVFAIIGIFVQTRAAKGKS